MQFIHAQSHSHRLSAKKIARNADPRQIFLHRYQGAIHRFWLSYMGHHDCIFVVGRTLCLDTFTVALNETCSDQGSYLTTENLQLTSLQFCMACCSVSTLHVKVGRLTPRRLWPTPTEELSTGSGSRRRGSKGGDSAVNRVPLLRARGVT